MSVDTRPPVIRIAKATPLQPVMAVEGPISRLIESTPDIRDDIHFERDVRSFEEQVASLARAATNSRRAPSESRRPAEAEPTTGARRMVDIEPVEPPVPLVDPFMATYEATILYGPGGVGKGTTAAWMALRHLQGDAGAHAYILDFEHHPSEWSGRLRRLGATDEELGRVVYASPFSREWTLPQGALTQVAPYIKAECDRLEITLIVIDSYSAATSSGDTMGGQPAATEYFAALSLIGRRTLTLAHVTGNSQKWPDRPFGSVFVHNWARETWAIEKVETDGQTMENEHGLTYMTVELRNKKAQERERPRHQRITYEFVPYYGAISAKLSAIDRNHAELIHESLSRTPGDFLTADQIVNAVKADTGETLTVPQVYDAIRRNVRSRHKLFEMDEAKRPFSYRIAQG